jgi:hypothetical protein
MNTAYPGDYDAAYGYAHGPARVYLPEVALEPDHEEQDQRPELREHHDGLGQERDAVGDVPAIHRVGRTDDADHARADDHTDDYVAYDLGLSEPREEEASE